RSPTGGHGVPPGGWCSVGLAAQEGRDVQVVAGQVGRGRGAGGSAGGGGAAGAAQAQHVHRAGDRVGVEAVVDRQAGGAVADHAHRTLRFLAHAHVAAAVFAVADRLAGDGAVQAGGDDGHAHLVLHVRIQHGADHHGRVLGGERLDGAADLVELGHGEVRAGGDVDQDAVGAGQVDVVQQRVLDGGLGGGLGAVVAACRAGAHHRQAHLGHDGADVGEVDVDQARAHDQVGDALHRALQHVVGGAE